jgi:hypothetical protein
MDYARDILLNIFFQFSFVYQTGSQFFSYNNSINHSWERYLPQHSMMCWVKNEKKIDDGGENLNLFHSHPNAHDIIIMRYAKKWSFMNLRIDYKFNR